MPGEFLRGHSISWQASVGVVASDFGGAITPLSDAAPMTDNYDEIVRVSGTTFDSHSAESVDELRAPETLAYVELLESPSFQAAMSVHSERGHTDLGIVEEVALAPELEQFPDVVQALFLKAVTVPMRRAAVMIAMTQVLPKAVRSRSQYEWQYVYQDLGPDSGLAVLHYPSIDIGAVTRDVFGE